MDSSLITSDIDTIDTTETTSAADRKLGAATTPHATHEAGEGRDVEGRLRRAKRGDLIGGRYVVDAQIGRGGMGRVLRVRHQVLGKEFALKLIRTPIATNERMREMFYREARLASALSHENICSIVDFGEDENFGLFMVMELLEGRTIFDKMAHDGPFAPRVVCDIVWQVAQALRYIHGRSIIHGDIKSENILLTRTRDRRRVIKLLDFGLARARATGDGITIEGTPEYISPERITGAAPTPSCDIYALGILFYECLVGKVPFQGTVEEVFNMHLDEQIANPSTLLKEPIDERIDELIAHATAKSPEDRPPDVEGFLYELRTFMNMAGMEGARRRVGSAEHSKRTRRSRDEKDRAATEVFTHAAIPLACLSGTGRVRVANQSFYEFLGIAGGAAGVDIGDSHLPALYPELLEDLRHIATHRGSHKRVLRLDDGGGNQVTVAVLLHGPPKDCELTAGEVHLAIHPLGRGDEPGRRD